MKNFSFAAKAYVMGTILIGLGLVAWKVTELDWTNIGLYLLAAVGAVAQTLKVEGPNNRTNYNVALFVYGFAFIALGPGAAVFVIVMSHLVDWIWHRYPWFIQSFNIGAYAISVYLAGVAIETVSLGTQVLDLNVAVSMVAANLVFVFVNHFLVGAVVKLARGQSFAESGVFGFFTLFLDFTLLSMGTVTALIWSDRPFASLLNILPLYLLYNAIRVPALKRQLQEMKRMSGQMRLDANGD
jgi:hypothetical protein